MNRRTSIAITFGAVCAIAAACSVNGENAPIATGEPLVVHDAQFRQGPLPGTAPDLDAGPPVADGDAGITDPQILTIESQNNIIYPGLVGKKLAGLASGVTLSVGVKFDQLGTGYWTFPVGVEDPQNPGSQTWEMTADYAADLAPGIQHLRFVGFDGNGTPGQQRDLKVCVPDYLEGLHVCKDTIEVPGAVVTLSWDRDVDLDLHVITPEGKDVSPKHPSTAIAATDGGITPDPKVDGTIDRDSNAGCAIDSARREKLSWPAYPPAGRYTFRANLFDSCSQPGVTFTLAVWVATGEGTTRHLEKRFEQNGFLLPIDENASSETGIFITQFDF